LNNAHEYHALAQAANFDTDANVGYSSSNGIAAALIDMHAGPTIKHLMNICSTIQRLRRTKWILKNSSQLVSRRTFAPVFRRRLESHTTFGKQWFKEQSPENQNGTKPQRICVTQKLVFFSKFLEAARDMGMWITRNTPFLMHRLPMGSHPNLQLFNYSNQLKYKLTKYTH
jgi:hypothetical protein